MGADEAVRQLLSGPVCSPSEAEPPRAAGFYAWWCRCERLEDASPALPREQRLPVPASWSLLYVGIAPVAPGSGRTLAKRFTRDHVGGNIGGSTFRQSVASLLLDRLELQPRPGSDRSRLVSEAPLSEWIETSCGVTFARVEQPWALEETVIRMLKPPLNIQNGVHPFRLDVSTSRRALKQACAVG